jgi:DtxR family Mn-dependent transcriptional regulator
METMPYTPVPDPALALTVFAVIAAAGALLFWPVRGVVPRWRRARRLNDRVLAEDALKHIAKRDIAGGPATLHGVAGALGVSPDTAAGIVERLQAAGWVTNTDAGDLQPTEAGREVAMHVVRVHRLWESYLAEETGYGERDWHDLAEIQEHALDAEAADALAMRLGDPRYDPHGDPIPDAAGELRHHGGRPLTGLPAGAMARIVHVEDEPETVYGVLVELGMHPGQVVSVEEATPALVVIRTEGHTLSLGPAAAANLSVIPIEAGGGEGWPAGEPDLEGTIELCDLATGEAAVVHWISPRCHGAERRRLMDLGVLPGTPIRAELDGPSGDPRAYVVRGALIALRADTAQWIRVRIAGARPEAA